MTGLIDIHGNSLRLQKEPQTENDAKLAQLRRHYSEHPTVGLTPGKAAAALKEAEEGSLIAQCELAEDMEEKDAHLQSELGKRRRSLLGVSWTIEPPRNATPAEQRDCEMIRELLEDFTWLDDAIFDATGVRLRAPPFTPEVVRAGLNPLPGGAGEATAGSTPPTEQAEVLPTLELPAPTVPASATWPAQRSPWARALALVAGGIAMGASQAIRCFNALNASLQSPQRTSPLPW